MPLVQNNRSQQISLYRLKRQRARQHVFSSTGLLFGVHTYHGAILPHRLEQIIFDTKEASQVLRLSGVNARIHPRAVLEHQVLGSGPTSVVHLVSFDHRYAVPSHLFRRAVARKQLRFAFKDTYRFELEAAHRIQALKQPFSDNSHPQLREWAQAHIMSVYAYSAEPGYPTALYMDACVGPVRKPARFRSCAAGLNKFEQYKCIRDWLASPDTGRDRQAFRAQRIDFAKQLFKAFAVCLEAGILHLDINTANCFLWIDRDPAAPVLKLGDFGSSLPVGSTRELSFITYPPPEVSAIFGMGWVPSALISSFEHSWCTKDRQLAPTSPGTSGLQE